MGYFLYIPLFVSCALALGVGVIAPFREYPSLTEVIPRVSRSHITAALLFILLFFLASGYAVLSSNLTMMEVWW